jgi:hypothetical protein
LLDGISENQNMLPTTEDRNTLKLMFGHWLGRLIFGILVAVVLLGAVSPIRDWLLPRSTAQTQPSPDERRAQSHGIRVDEGATANVEGNAVFGFGNGITIGKGYGGDICKNLLSADALPDNSQQREMVFEFLRSHPQCKTVAPSSR